MIKERFQNPAVLDEVNLRIFAFNANAPKDFQDIEKVEIYYLDPTLVSESNPDGRTLIDTVLPENIHQDKTGEYYITLTLASEQYVIGRYYDVWHVTMQGDHPTTVQQPWEVYPSLWFTTPAPIAYDFRFDFRPNKIRKGSKRYIIIDVTPNVPTAPDLYKYYTALIVGATIRFYVQLVCGNCMPQEEDLRTLVDGEEITYRERNQAFYQIDTTDDSWQEGVYDIWCEMDLGGNIYVSEKQQIQIY